jgi:hypothetical protein
MSRVWCAVLRVRCAVRGALSAFMFVCVCTPMCGFVIVRVRLTACVHVCLCECVCARLPVHVCMGACVQRIFGSCGCCACVPKRVGVLLFVCCVSLAPVNAVAVPGAAVQAVAIGAVSSPGS